ncbi:unnamed protein product [Symbiodinium natans]|uniref:C2H2-type domain-containing protein n=1 Tax=Symbiodinium natans TaxID=878477 RepID=A0A812JF33_9DINO|nr:unnamed protein product [Symbiodinium natans]
MSRPSCKHSHLTYSASDAAWACWPLWRVDCAAIWAVIYWERDWLAQVCLDLEWLWQFAAADLPRPRRDTWYEWRCVIVDHIGTFRGMIQRAGQRAAKAAHAEQALQAALRPLHAWGRTQVDVALPSPSSGWWCPPCEKVFRNKAALGVHFFLWHGRVARFRHLAQGSLCMACHKEYHTHDKLKLHLRASQRCCDVLEDQGVWRNEVSHDIGSRQWRQQASKDLGLALPRRESVVVANVAAEAEAWRVNPVVNTAYLDIGNALMGHQGESETLIDIVLVGLAKFPLYPQEQQDIARKLYEASDFFGVRLPQNLETSVRDFFYVEDARLDREEKVNRSAPLRWRSPDGVRPAQHGAYVVFSCVSHLGQERQEHLAAALRVQLGDPWHGDEWPLALSVSPSPLADSGRGDLAKGLLCLYQHLWRVQGWLRAPSSFWHSTISAPFRGFHSAF